MDEEAKTSPESTPGEAEVDADKGNKDAVSSAQAESTEKSSEEFKSPIDFKKPVFISKSQRSTISKQDKGVENEEEVQESSSEVAAAQPVQPKASSKSPAQQIVEKTVPIPYKEPKWSGLPSENYSFEVLKNGTIVDTVALNKPYIVIGRLAQCDILMEHPSISRFHCVIQYRDVASEGEACGFYAYDLGSTHGSFHNKHQMKPHIYYRLRVGHMIKLGGSTRTLILQGPDEDQEPETEETVTELKAAAEKKMKKLEKLESGELEEEDRDRRIEEALSGKDASRGEESGGIDWGMGDDAEEPEEEDSGVNPFASLNEELYLDDPKKTLRGWYEREGYDLPEYETEDISPGYYRCRLELPVPGPGGGPLVAIAEHRGKKKEVVVQCALEACRQLDRLGVLRQAKHESHEKKRRDWAENDYYDSDEDNFLDRTGDVERKRIKRMKDGGSKDSSSVETYDSLIKKYNEVIEELSSLEDKLVEADRLKQTADEEDEDDLDSFMQKLKSQVPDKHKRVTWKLRTIELRKEELRIRRLTNVARPLGIPELKPYVSKIDTQSSSQKVAVDALSRKKMMLKKAAILPKAQPKEPTFQVHKVFLEEEPVKKLKLKRLDDDDDEPPPLPKPASKPKPKASKQPYEEKYKLPEVPKVKGPSKPEVIPSVPSVESTTGQSENGKFLVPQAKPPSLPAKGESKPIQESTVSESLPPAKTAPSESSVIQSSTSKDSGDKNPSKCEGKEDTPPEKKQRMMGPMLPPTLELVRASQQEPKKSKKKHEKKTRKYDDESSNYTNWVPPVGQTGDGRTRLNDKFGY